MNTSKMLKIARAAGVGAALSIPAWVVAQQAPFASGNLLRANDLNALANRISSLEASANRSNGVSVVPVEASSAPVTVGDVATARVSCTGGQSIVSCGCRGTNGNTNSLGGDLRHVEAVNSECICQAQNVGNNDGLVLTARAICLSAQ